MLKHERNSDRFLEKVIRQMPNRLNENIIEVVKIPLNPPLSKGGWGDLADSREF